MFLRFSVSLFDYYGVHYSMSVKSTEYGIRLHCIYSLKHNIIMFKPTKVGSMLYVVYQNCMTPIAELSGETAKGNLSLGRLHKPV